MGESALHIRLVILLADWISQSLLNGNSGIMLVDHPGASSKNKPSKVNNFVPDVLVPRTRDYNFIIGEAETARSLDKIHSREQMRAFLSKCQEYDISYFILAVPWDMVRLGEAIVKEQVREIGATRVVTNVLEQLPA